MFCCGWQNMPTAQWLAHLVLQTQAEHRSTHTPTISAGVIHELGEKHLVSDNSPCGSSLGRLAQPAIEPVLLPRAHQRPRGVVVDFFDIGVVPTQSGNAAVIVPGVEHDEVQELAHLEGTPDSEIVVQLDLPTPS